MVYTDRSITRRKKRHTVSPIFRHVFLGVSACVSIGMLVLGVWYVTRSSMFSIQEIVVEGGETIAPEHVREEVVSFLQGSYMAIIPYTFSLLYPEERVASVVEAMPRVKSVTVRRDTKKIAISFTEYIPHALWCMSGESGCYFLDETGYAFAPGPLLEGGSLVRHVMDSEEELREKQLFDSNWFIGFHEFLKKLNDVVGIRVTEIQHTKDKDMILKINGGGMLYIDEDSSYDHILKNIESVLSSDEFKHLEPGTFQYIDLRFGNKVFVNEGGSHIDVATSSSTLLPEE